MKDIVAKNKVIEYPFLIFALALTTALGILFLPLSLFCSLVLILICAALYVKFPTETMIAFGIFLIFQGIIAFQFRETPRLEKMLKRSEEVFIFAAFLLLFLKKVFHKEKWKRTIIDTPLICLTCIAVVSSIKNHIAPYRLAGFDLFLLLKGFLVFYIFYYSDLNGKEIRRVAKVFFVVSLVVFLLGIADFVTPATFRTFINNVPYVDYRFGILSVQSIFTHPGIFGWFATFFALFCFAFFIISEKGRYLLFSILLSLGTLLSMRFKPLAGLLAAVSVAFIIIPGSKKIRYTFIMILLILIYGTFWGAKLTMLFEDRISMYLQSPAIREQARNVLYITSFRIAKDFFPLGSGLATFGGWIAALYYSPLYNQYGLNLIFGLEKGGHFLTDTFWPYLIAQLGFIGTACYIWIFISLFYSMVKYFKKTKDSFLKAFTLGTILISVEAVVESIAAPIFVSPPQYFFIFACLGITCSIARPNKLVNISENPSNK